MVRKTYLLEGLCCPNCAEKIKTKTGQFRGVIQSSVDFPNKLLILDFEGDEQPLLGNIIAAIQEVDEDIIVTAC